LLSSSDLIEECRCLLELPVRLREVPVDGSYVESDSRRDLALALSLCEEQDDSLLDGGEHGNGHDTPLAVNAASVFRTANAALTPC